MLCTGIFGALGALQRSLKQASCRGVRSAQDLHIGNASNLRRDLAANLIP